MTTQILNRLDQVVEQNQKKMSTLPWADTRFYSEWLAQSYFFVCHSTRLLGLSLSRCELSQGDLHQRIAHHVSEELFHERLAAKDLSRLFQKIENFQESSATKLFYRNQYFGIERFGPVYLLGYILFLEAISVHAGKVIYSQAKEIYGDPACSFLRIHVTEDVDHLEKAKEQVSAMSPAEQQIVLESLEMSAYLYDQVLESCLPNYEQNLIQKALPKNHTERGAFS